MGDKKRIEDNPNTTHIDNQPAEDFFCQDCGEPLKDCECQDEEEEGGD